MIEGAEFLTAAKARGYDFCAGVPCSFLNPLINAAISDPEIAYVGATSEGEAVGIAAGAWFAGRKAMVLFQNSGLGNAVNPITSLCDPFNIPLLLISSWRGEVGVPDEPQHQLMGEITQGLLAMMRVPAIPFPAHASDIGAALVAVDASLSRRRTTAMIAQKAALRDNPVLHQRRPGRVPGTVSDLRRGDDLPSRMAVLEALAANWSSDSAVIATTGKAGRELFTLGDHPNQLYCVGSMGCASAIGLGVALCSSRQTIVLDGDGAALMKLGNVATIGSYAPKGYVHIILDNETHDSTGGQATVSPSVDFAAIAAACGYANAVRADTADGCVRALASARDVDGPTLIHAKIGGGSLQKLGRPTVTPVEVADRFRSFLASDLTP